jgi:hypothetical protein
VLLRPAGRRRGGGEKTLLLLVGLSGRLEGLLDPARVGRAAGRVLGEKHLHDPCQRRAQGVGQRGLLSPVCCAQVGLERRRAGERGDRGAAEGVQVCRDRRWLAVEQLRRPVLVRAGPHPCIGACALFEDPRDAEVRQHPPSPPPQHVAGFHVAVQDRPRGKELQRPREVNQQRGRIRRPKSLAVAEQVREAVVGPRHHQDPRVGVEPLVEQGHYVAPRVAGEARVDRDLALGQTRVGVPP